MKLPVTFLCATLAAGAAFADPYSTAMRQAITAANSGAGSGEEVPPPATSAPPQNNPPPNPVLQATLQNIADLQNDFAVIAGATGTNSLTGLKPSMTTHLAAAAQGTKASQASVSKLADDLLAAIGGNEKLRAQLPKLAQFTHASFNGSQLTDDQKKMIFDGAQKILTGAGVSPDGAARVVEDLKSIAGETK
jgi:hypothetical protein